MTGATSRWRTGRLLAANAAWLTCAATAHYLRRAAGSLASLAHGQADGATIRRDLIDVAARTTRPGRGHITSHLPAGRPRQSHMLPAGWIEVQAGAGRRESLSRRRNCCRPLSPNLA